MALTSLTGVSRRYAQERPGRTLVTAAGIALGVAMFFGVVVSTLSINRFFARVADDLTGRSDVTAQAANGTGQGSLPADALARVRAAPGVVAAAPAVYGGAGAKVTITGDLRARGVRPQPGGTLPSGPVTTTQGFTVAGTDFASATRLTSFPLQPGGRLPRPGADELLLTPTLAGQLGVRSGGTVHIIDGPGERPFSVVGVFRPDTSIGYFTGGELAHMPLDSAQRLLGKPGQVAAIDVRLAPGVRPDRWIEANRALFGADANVIDTAALLEPLRHSFKAPADGFMAISTLALWLGAFLIYLTVSMNVLERTRLFGTLFALGASRRQVARLVLTEAALAGTAGSLVGLGLGVGFAVVLVRLTAQWFHLHSPPLALSPLAAAIGFTAGLVTTIGAALIPARRAAAISPVEALRADAERPTAGSHTWRVGVPLLAFGASSVLWYTTNRVVTLAVSLSLLLGAVLVVPVALAPLAGLAGRVTSRVGRSAGRIAVMHLAKERSRSSFTLALVMVVLAIGIGLNAATAASARENDRQLASQFGADMRVYHDGFSQSQLDLVRGTGGVAVASPVALAFPGGLLSDRPTEPAHLEVIDPATYFEVAGFAWADGDTVSARRDLSGSGTALLSLATAMHLGLHRGDTVRVRTATGPRPFRVAGTFVSILAGPAIVVGAHDAALFGSPRTTELDVRLAGGAKAAAVQRALTRAAAARNDGFAFSTSAQVVANVRENLHRASQLYDSLLLVALLVSMLGLANTLAMSVIERRREIGVLRSIGVSRLGVARVVLTESAVLVGIAFVLALPLGAVIAVDIVRSVANSFGFHAVFTYPWRSVPRLLVTAASVVAVASIIPARRAARLDIVDALRLD